MISYYNHFSYGYISELKKNNILSMNKDNRDFHKKIIVTFKE